MLYCSLGQLQESKYLWQRRLVQQEVVMRALAEAEADRGIDRQLACAGSYNADETMPAGGVAYRSTWVS